MISTTVYTYHVLIEGTFSSSQITGYLLLHQYSFNATDMITDHINILIKNIIIIAIGH